MCAAAYPQTLPTLYSRLFTKYATRRALTDSDETLTYGEVDDRSGSLANGLVEHGVEPGDTVALLLNNSVAGPVADAAVARAGAARLPLTPSYTRGELRQRLADACVETLLCDAAYADLACTLSEKISSLERIVVRGKHASNTLSWDSLLAEHADADPPAVTVEPDELAGHYYTGGTTGEPKGVRYTHRTLVANLLAHPPELGFHADDIGLVTTPLAHSAGTFCWATLLVGGTVHIHEAFDVEAVLQTIETQGVTWTFAVPTMIYRLLDVPSLDEFDLSSLERLVYGAAPMRPDRLREGIDRLGSVFTQFYGQTEVPNLISTFGRTEHTEAVETGDHDRLRSAGTPCLQSEVRIVDTETGEVCPPGEPGEVTVSAPYAFDGYVERPEATAETLRDGWVYTGDIGVLDEDGYLTLLDRKSGVIVTGGMNVYSGEVENALTEHPGVEAAAVVGVPDAEWGEAVHAVVVPAPDSAVDEDTLRAFVGERLASYKRPKAIEFASRLPTTPLGKIDRETVRERYWEDRDRSV